MELEAKKAAVIRSKDQSWDFLPKKNISVQIKRKSEPSIFLLLGSLKREIEIIIMIIITLYINSVSNP